MNDKLLQKLKLEIQLDNLNEVDGILILLNENFISENFNIIPAIIKTAFNLFSKWFGYSTF